MKDTSTEITDAHSSAAHSLLTEGLRMPMGSRLLILHQAEHADLAECITLTARALSLTVDRRPFSAKDFASGYPREFSPAELADSVPLPSGIVLLIDWDPATTSGRLQLLTDLDETGKPWRVASMPGVNLTLFPLCQGDIAELTARCRDVFAAMARSRILLVHTRSPEGHTDTLVVPLGEHCPIISTGAIDEGQWGNFPSGETFVVPEPWRAQGWITLRGSFPRYVLGSGEWVRFEINDGRIIARTIQASSRSLKSDFSGSFYRKLLGRRLSPNSDVLAELGVGTNSGIDRLTGNPIFDEKKLGTLHLGFGSNHQFKGPIASKSHVDVTFEGATLETINGTTIVREGNYVLTGTAAVPEIHETRLPWISSDPLAANTTLNYELSVIKRALEITYYPSRGASQKVSVPLGSHARLTKQILESPDPVAEATAMSGATSGVSRAVLEGLVAYNVLRTKP